MKKISIYKRLTVGMLACLAMHSCNFLDVVPDDVPTIDHAFANRYEMNRVMYGCFGFLPSFADPSNYPGFYGCDELWLAERNESVSKTLWGLGKGEQGTQNPLYDCYSARFSLYELNHGSAYFTAISDCNIFLQNANTPADIDDLERAEWIANVKFVKAYYHFLLLRQYGAIPIMRENVDISGKAGEVVIYREPIDDVVEYIVELLDEAVQDLPVRINDRATYLGFPTKATALAVKGQALVWAASPLFNGNTDYVDIKDNRGIELFPQEYDSEKWTRAADALKEAIDMAREGGHILNDFGVKSTASKLNEKTIVAMQNRAAVVERWNDEIVWGDSRTNPTTLQRTGFPQVLSTQGQGGLLRCLAPPIHIVEQFYTKNGVPIKEDVDWVGVPLMGLTTSDAEHQYYMKKGMVTINMHMNREPRFYGAISFDGSRYFGNSRITEEDDYVTNSTKVWYVGMKASDPNGGAGGNRFSVTGYQCKKVVHYESTVSDVNGGSYSMYRYAFPIIRLADIYLMYAEALNESKSAPDADVYEYIDLVRDRSGLDGVVDSWKDHAIDADKPLTKEGMRDIIRRERLIELAFEGHRLWDLRRWKLAEEYWNRPIQGLNLNSDEPAEMYVPQTLFEMKFEKKDYLWPIRQAVLSRNANLVQNLDW